MIGAAVTGARAYSFAAYLLVSEAIATGLAWRAFHWRPRHGPRWSSVRGLMRTGADITSYQVIAHLTQQIDAIIVGRFFGAHALGLYNRANQLLVLPQLHVAAPLNQVAMVTLSRIEANSRDFEDHARSTACVVTHLVLPLFAVCIVLPQETVRLLLGAQWPDAAPLLRVLAIAAAAATITALAYSINVAAGQTRRLVISAAVALPITAVAAWLGTKHGPIGVAENIAIVNVSLVLPRLWWSLRGMPEGLLGYARSLVGPIVASGVFAIGLWLGRSSVEESNWPIRLAIAVGGGALALSVLAAVWPRLRREWRIVAASLPFPRSREK